MTFVDMAGLLVVVGVGERCRLIYSSTITTRMTEFEAMLINNVTGSVEPVLYVLYGIRDIYS